MRATPLLLTAALVLGLAACSNLPSLPSQPARYDLGPALAGQEPAPASTAIALPVLALDDIQARTQNENSTAVLYRLGYVDAQALYAFAYARWSQPPAVLVQQRLREVLSQGRTVLSSEGGALAPLVQGRPVPVLQLSLEEFTQTFSSAQQSDGVVRVRATLVEPLRSGDVLLGQKVFAVRQPATSANAAGGVQALAQATDQVGAQLQQWLAQLPAATQRPAK